MIYINGRFLINNPTGIENFAYGMCKAMLEKGINLLFLHRNRQLEAMMLLVLI